jgi:hypothetical protein
MPQFTLAQFVLFDEGEYLYKIGCLAIIYSCQILGLFIHSLFIKWGRSQPDNSFWLTPDLTRSLNQSFTVYSHLHLEGYRNEPLSPTKLAGDLFDGGFY